MRTQLKPIACILVSLTLIVLQAKAQNKPNNRKIAMSYSPFKKVKVIDNRIDSNTYLNLDGKYPIKGRFNYSAFADTVEQFYNNELQKTVTGTSTLLISFEQFRIPNRDIIHTRSKKRGDIWLKAREFIFIKVSMYSEKGDSLQKIAYVETKMQILEINEKEIYEILGQLFQIACLHFKDDTSRKKTTIPAISLRMIRNAYNIIEPDTDRLVSKELELNKVKNRYAELKINKNILTKNCCFNKFLSFRDNEQNACDLQVKFDTKDSTYVAFNSSILKSGSTPFIIFYESNFFINFYENRYLKMIKNGSSFSITLPMTYPNAYESLSHPGRIKKYKKKIEETGVVGQKDTFIQYRSYFLDMDNGDIVFGDR
ncbi:MAG: hypothetical protein GXC73_19560 [Chitinophagaceae bacterium]|nr:hypothetical protein [Chitinophagaceae bacterium]